MEQLVEHVARCIVQPAPATGRASYAIREATMADAPSVARIYNDSVEWPHHVLGSSEGKGRSHERSRVGPMSVESMRLWMTQHGVLARELWLALSGEQPVGWLSFMGFADRPGMAYTSELAIYVAADRRAAGVGTHLLSNALQRATSMGLDCLLAMVWSDNDASQHLFRRQGFVPWGRMPEAVWAYGASRDMLVLGRRVAAQP
jgi:L-amino acid N-acyltransferase YncA